MPAYLLDRRATGSSHRARIVSLLLAALVGCGGGEVLLVPLFTFGFAFNGPLAGANPDVFLNLNPNAPTTATGSFEAGSTLRIDTDSRKVTGSYSGCTLTLSVGPFETGGGGTLSPLIAAGYNGRFLGPNTIELTPSSGSQPMLTLIRFSTISRPTTC